MPTKAVCAVSVVMRCQSSRVAGASCSLGSLHSGVRTLSRST
ncbi:hypothetical protein [Variovorax sp.]|nr:hypothetical protein [Variovorax sp.]